MNILDILKDLPWVSIGAVGTTMLAIINGLILLQKHITNKPKFVINPVHNDEYLWWVRLSSGDSNGQKTRRYAFLAYISVANIGNRSAKPVRTRLKIRMKNFRFVQSPLFNINEPSIELPGIGTKKLAVFNQNSENYEAVESIKSGESTAGMTCFFFEFFGDETFNPRMVNDKVRGKISITDVFGRTYKRKIVFVEKDIFAIQTILPEIDLINTVRELEELL